MLRWNCMLTARPRDARGRFIKSVSSSSSVPPLVSFQVTNPVTFIKYWWDRVIGNEGVDVHLRIKPLTAIAIALAISGGGFVLGRLTLPAGSPITKYIPQLAPTPTPDPWRETAIVGRVYQSGGRSYLLTAQSVAISLEVSPSVDISKLIGRRILATGRYNSLTKFLYVTSAASLEILPASPVPVPTLIPTPSPEVTPVLSPTLFPTSSPASDSGGL